MIDRRSLVRYASASTFGALALTAVAGGADASAEDGGGGLIPVSHQPMPNPAVDPVPNPPFPNALNRPERAHLKTFDELDFVVFSGQQWDRLGESHATNIRVHMPDGSFTDGLTAHIQTLAGLFSYAPDTRIHEHPIRIAKNDLTAVTGVMRGTFTQPMQTPNGVVPPNGKKFAINMATIGLWNRKGVMDEEWLFWDNLTFLQQLGLA
jgi:SnoaL-like polyketide cyclase